MTATTNRMSLSAITKGRIDRPFKMALYGVEGIGKSTFAAAAPDPIFIAAEDGTAALDIARFPSPETWADVMDAITTLYQEKHDFKTLVLDSADWAEQLANDAVAKENNVAGIEAIGYGKGHVFAGEKFMQLLRGFDALLHKGMNVIVVAHTTVKTFNDPEHEPYDRYMLKLSKQNGPRLTEWCDILAFANYDTRTENVGNDKNPNMRAKSFNKRLLYTERRAAFDAKNRFGLSEKMNLDWPTFWGAYQDALNT